MPEQSCSDSLFSGSRSHVGVADECHVTFVLDSHDPEKLSILLKAPENNIILDFVPKLFNGHVRLMPAIFWYDSFIGLSRIIDDLKDCVEIGFGTLPYHPYHLPNELSSHSDKLSAAIAVLELIRFVEYKLYMLRKQLKVFFCSIRDKVH